jgi:hypothetical protein
MENLGNEKMNRRDRVQDAFAVLVASFATGCGNLLRAKNSNQIFLNAS